MTEEKEKKKKSDEEILFPEVKIKVKNMKGKEKEYVIRPWSFGELVEISPLIENIFQDLKKRGTVIDPTNFTFDNMKDVYFSSIKHVGEIIAKTLKIEKAELSDLSVPSAVNLALGIFNANLDNLGNIISPFSGLGGAIEEESPSVSEEKDQD